MIVISSLKRYSQKKSGAAGVLRHFGDAKMRTRFFRCTRKLFISCRKKVGFALCKSTHLDILVLPVPCYRPSKLICYNFYII